MKSETDTISLNDLSLTCLVGIREREQRSPQPLLLDLTMTLPLWPAATTGDLARTINYAAVAKQAEFVAAHGQWGLLESLAHALCALLLLPPADGEERASLCAAEVRIRKPEALKGVATPSVHVRRDASSAAPDEGARRVLCGGSVALDVLCEAPLGAAYRLTLAPGASLLTYLLTYVLTYLLTCIETPPRPSGASWPLPPTLAAHVIAGVATAADERLKPGDVLPRGAAVTLAASDHGAALILAGPHALAALAAPGAGGASSSADGATVAYIALGSNLGHRARQIGLALDALRERCGEVRRGSPPHPLCCY